MSEDQAELEAVVAAVGRAAREIMTSWLVHEDRERARELIVEHLDEYGELLLAALGSFLSFHMTHPLEVEVAEDRFIYLLARVGDLTDLMAECTDRDSAMVLLWLGEIFENGEAEAESEVERGAWRLAHTCAIDHHQFRRSGSSWGIYQTLSPKDMLVLTEALAQAVMLIAASSPDVAQVRVCEKLLGDAERILTLQARANGVNLECQIERYFTGLAATESDRESSIEGNDRD